MAKNFQNEQIIGLQANYRGVKANVEAFNPLKIPQILCSKI